MERTISGKELLVYFKLKSRRINRTYPYYILCLEFFPMYELPEMIHESILEELKKSFRKILKKIDGEFICLRADHENISVIARFKVFRNISPAQVANHIKMSSSRDLKKKIPTCLPEEIQMLLKKERYWSTPYNVLPSNTEIRNFAIEFILETYKEDYRFPSEPLPADFFKPMPKK